MPINSQLLLFFPQRRNIFVWKTLMMLINNNVIEAFNGQFKAWYKPKRGFNSFESANRLIATYIFFYNFVRPHLSLNGLTPAQVAGAKYSETRTALLVIGSLSNIQISRFIPSSAVR
jgi:hypothetical protein